MPQNRVRGRTATLCRAPNCAEPCQGAFCGTHEDLGRLLLLGQQLDARLVTTPTQATVHLEGCIHLNPDEARWVPYREAHPGRRQIKACGVCLDRASEEVTHRA